MSDFLTNLVQRSIAPNNLVRPQLVSLFEPAAPNDGAFFEPTDTAKVPIAEAQPQPLQPNERISRVESLWRDAPLVVRQVSAPRSDESTTPQRPKRVQAEIEDRAPFKVESAGKPMPAPEVMELTSPEPPPVSAEPSRQTIQKEEKLELPTQTRATQRELHHVRNLQVLSPIRPSQRIFHLTQPARDEKRAPAAPSINVTIGRVEVRATSPAPSAPARPPARAPITSLDDYLRKRAGGNPG
jgi:hypothetical protein